MMTHRRVLCMALAAVLTSTAAPSWAQGDRDVAGPVVESTAIATSGADAITFKTAGSELFFDTTGWADGTSAITINYGHSLSFIVDLSATGALTISGATGPAIYNRQIDNNSSIYDAVLDLSALEAVTLTGNVSTGDGGGIYIATASNQQTNLTLGDNVTITGNKAGRGAAIFASSFDNNTNVSLGNNLLISDNISSSKRGGGAVNLDSGNEETYLTIGQEAVFSNNSLITTSGYNSGGGAIKLDSGQKGRLEIGSGAKFVGNHVTVSDGSKDNGGSGGGAIHTASSNTSVDIAIGANSLFSGNWADIKSSSSIEMGGGAIFMFGGRPELTIDGGTRFENNSASYLGGAIYLAGWSTNPTLKLDTDDGDIVFTGNKHGVTTFTDGRPDDGTANAIHLVTGSKNAEINITGDSNIYFDDPIEVVARNSSSKGSATLTLGAADDFTGFVQFLGQNDLGSSGQVMVKEGGLRLAGSASGLTADTFTMEAGGALAGAGTITADGSISIDGTGGRAVIDPDSAIFDSGVKAPTIVGGVGSPYAAALIAPDQAIGTLTLSSSGAVSLNETTLSVDLDGADNSDVINIDGSLDQAVSLNNSVNIGAWSKGRYTIMNWDDVSGGSLTIGNQNTDNFNTTDITAGGMALTDRMAAALSLSGNSLVLDTTAVTNKTLTWTGDDGDDWNFSAANKWKDSASTPTTFAQGDKVIFDAADSTQTIKVAGQSSANTDYRVQVSDMVISDGSVTFQGGAIIGRADEEAMTGSKGQLTVSGADTLASINNTIDFEGGVEISQGGAMTVNFDSEDPAVQGFITSSTSVNLNGSDSNLVFSLNFDPTAQSPVYAFGGQLTGSGTVAADIGDSDSPGYLLLTSADSTLSGLIKVTSSGTNQAGLILTNAQAAGSADISLESDKTLLSLDFGLNGGSGTHNFTNVVRAEDSAADISVDIHSGRAALGGLAGYDRAVNVHEGGTLAFLSDDVDQTTAHTIGSGNVTVNVLKGGAIVGGDGGTINGTLNLADKSILEITAGNSELSASILDLTAAASVAKRFKTNETWAEGQQYAVLTGGTTNGDKNILAGDLSTLISSGELVWGPDDVLYYRHGGSHEAADNAGLTGNQTRTARAVDSLDQSSPLYTAIVNGGPADQAGYVLDQVSGQIHGAISGALRETPLAFNQTVTDEVRSLRGSLVDLNQYSYGDGPNEARVWLNVGYSRSNFDGGSGRYETSAKGPQAAIGLDKSFDDNWFAGAALHYGRQDIDQARTRSEAQVDSYTFGLYGGREFCAGPGALRFTLGTALTRHNIETDRRALIATLDEKLKADYDGSAWQVFAEAAYGFRLSDRWAMEPYLNLAYVRQKLDSFTEKGGLAVLHGQGRTDDDFYTTLGSRFTADLTDSTQFEFGLGWQHRFGDRWAESGLSFAQGSTPFSLESVVQDRDQALVSLGLKQELNDRATLKVNYSGGFGSDSDRHAGEALLSFSF